MYHFTTESLNRFALHTDAYTHGGINGFSRLVIYLHCSTTNSARQVLKAFITACLQYGLPSGVRSDHGSENYLVGLLMNVIRGSNRGSFITGRSVHNQRIERLWWDVHKEVKSEFYHLFYWMEDNGRLNSDNAIHRYASHKVFLLLINQKLATFRTAWNNHRMRTDHNRTPNQLWTQSNRSTCSRSHADIVGSEEMGDVPNFVQTLLQRMNASRANYHHNEEAIQDQADTSLNISL